MKAPADCANMSELRVQIDMLDKQLIEKLTHRVAYIDRAVELKPAEGLPARIADRVEQVAENARKNALIAGMDPDLAEQIWRILIDWSITREERVLGPSEERKTA